MRGLRYILYFCLCHFCLCSQQLKIFESRNQPQQKKIGPTKYSREKKIGPTEYPREKLLDPRNTHEEKLEPTKYPRKKFWTHEIPTEARWHDGTKPTRPTIPRDPRNLAHCFLKTLQTLYFFIVFQLNI